LYAAPGQSGCRHSGRRAIPETEATRSVATHQPPDPLLLSTLPGENRSSGEGEGGNSNTEDEPLRETEVPVTWDDPTGTCHVVLPDLPPQTSLVVTVPLQPLPDVMQTFQAGRQDQLLLVTIQVPSRSSIPARRSIQNQVIQVPNSGTRLYHRHLTGGEGVAWSTRLSPGFRLQWGDGASGVQGSVLCSNRLQWGDGASGCTRLSPLLVRQTDMSAEFNKDANTHHTHARMHRSESAATAVKSPRRTSVVPPTSPASPSGEVSGPRSANSSRPSVLLSVSPSHKASQPEVPRRMSLKAQSQIAIKQPFVVAITVQGCPQWTTVRRYFVQVVLNSKGPISVALHDCQLKLSPAYRLVQSPNAHLKDFVLKTGQEVRYSYLIERVAAVTGAPTSPGGGKAREVRSKLSVLCDYTWEDTFVLGRSGRLRRHYPPQQQHFERYFQDSAMLLRGDAIRTYVVRGHLVSAEEKTVPPPVVAPGDIDARGVVVGTFHNRVTSVFVGVPLRLEFTVQLSEEARREMREGNRGGKRLGLMFEVAADAADWAISGDSKGATELRVSVPCRSFAA
jgi:hypothetical protein